MRRIQQRKRKERLKERHKGKICLTRVLVVCFVDCASRYNRVKKNLLDAQLILSTKYVEVDEIYE
jgi:hypothetical protein